jgi:hypothetical protein
VGMVVGGGNVGGRVDMAVGGLHPTKNTVTNTTPIICCTNFGLFISCSLLCVVGCSSYPSCTRECDCALHAIEGSLGIVPQHAGQV